MSKPPPLRTYPPSGPYLESVTLNYSDGRKLTVPYSMFHEGVEEAHTEGLDRIYRCRFAFEVRNPIFESESTIEYHTYGGVVKVQTPEDAEAVKAFWDKHHAQITRATDSIYKNFLARVSNMVGDFYGLQRMSEGSNISESEIFKAIMEGFEETPPEAPAGGGTITRDEWDHDWSKIPPTKDVE